MGHLGEIPKGLFSLNTLFSQTKQGISSAELWFKGSLQETQGSI